MPALAVLGAVLLAACGGDDGGPGGSPARAAGDGQRGQGDRSGFSGGPPPGGAAVPVETATVVRRDISSYIETNGTLEAENEVDIIARVSAPIVELNAEEGMAVRKGQVLARLEEDELRARLEISRVALKEAELAYQRAQQLNEQRLISTEEYEQALTRFETAQAELEGNQILIGYTVIRAPFDGLIVQRYVDYAQQVATNAALFRISDFDPLLCPIRVPERELPRLELGQEAYVQVEAWGGDRFSARVLRISPVVDAATGTIKVTLEVRSKGKLRPGMFARAFLKTASKPAALVIPRSALSLESIGDTVYVVADGVAQRREVALGFQEGDAVEIVDGLSEGEQVVVVGQDGLSDGTPVELIGSNSPSAGATPSTEAAAPSTAVSSRDWGGEQGMRRFDISKATPEQLERFKATLKERGLSDAEIEQRLQAMRERRQGNGSP